MQTQTRNSKVKQLFCQQPESLRRKKKVSHVLSTTTTTVSTHTPAVTATTPGPCCPAPAPDRDSRGLQAAGGCSPTCPARPPLPWAPAWPSTAPPPARPPARPPEPNPGEPPARPGTHHRQVRPGLTHRRGFRPPLKLCPLHAGHPRCGADGSRELAEAGATTPASSAYASGTLYNGGGGSGQPGGSRRRAEGTPGPREVRLVLRHSPCGSDVRLRASGELRPGPVGPTPCLAGPRPAGSAPTA